ncbi:MAG: zf-HC2 domain-containing protein [Pirellulales bacterium]|nr:zf-HC2 domain-containing protein [Pirellulales bacterium]
MIHCEEILAIVNEYLDGELDKETSAKLDRHLAGCAACRTLIENLEHTIALYAQGHAVDVPPDACQHLTDLLRDRWATKFPTDRQAE